MSWMDDILDHVLGTTDQAPPGAKPDVAIRDPKTFRNLKGTREIRMQRSGEADKMRTPMKALESVSMDRGIKAYPKPIPKGFRPDTAHLYIGGGISNPETRHRELLEIFKGLGGGSNQP
jgi:hypothetical protein